MSPTLNGSSVLQRFEHGNIVEICNGIMFDFYLGLPHMHMECGPPTNGYVVKWLPAHMQQWSDSLFAWSCITTSWFRLKMCFLQMDFVQLHDIVFLLVKHAGTKTPCSNLYYWICCCHGSTVSGIGVTSHWILCKSNSKLNSLKVVFVKKFLLLHCTQLPYFGVKFTQFAGLLWAGGSLILFGYTYMYIVATIMLMYTYAKCYVWAGVCYTLQKPLG